MMRWLLLALVWMLPGSASAGESLTLALEPPQVDISAKFAGINLKAMGSMQGRGDLIIKVAGPAQEVKLSRKAKLGPFWIGGETVRMTDAPSLLFLYATAPIGSVLPLAERERYALLPEAVPLRIEPQLQADAASPWRKTFLRLKKEQGYYLEDNGAIRIFDSGQFTADIGLPSDLQVGTYTVETLLVRSGAVVGHTVGEFKVRLVGVERWVWNAAHDYAWLFGSLVTLAAMLLGIVLTAIPYRLR